MHPKGDTTPLVRASLEQLRPLHTLRRLVLVRSTLEGEAGVIFGYVEFRAGNGMVELRWPVRPSSFHAPFEDSNVRVKFVLNLPEQESALTFEPLGDDLTVQERSQFGELLKPLGLTP